MANRVAKTLKQEVEDEWWAHRHDQGHAQKIDDAFDVTK